MKEKYIWLNLIRLIIIILFVSVFMFAPQEKNWFPSFIKSAQADTSNITSTTDNYIHEANPDSNYGGANELLVYGANTFIAHVLVEFDLTGLDNAAVVSAATLGMYYYDCVGGSEGDVIGRTYTAYRLRRSDWSESQSTWNIYKTGSSWGTAGATNTTTDIDTSLTANTDMPAVYGWVEWNVLDIVQDAIDNQSDICRIYLYDAESSAWLGANFYSSDYGTAALRPQIKIDYTIASVPTVTKTATTNITNATAIGHGNITATGGINADKRGICYSTSNTTPSILDSTVEEEGDFSTGAFTESIPGLTEGTTYYLRAYAHNASGYGYSSIDTFTTASTAATWWDNDWRNRIELTFAADNLTENLRDFPVTLYLTTSRVDFADIKADGADIRLVDKDNVTQLPYHITQWNASTNATIVTKVPQIDALSNSDSIFLYYNNSGASDNQSANDVWTDTGAYTVLPFYTTDNNGATVYDSTSNSINGTVVDATWTAKGRQFNGTEYIGMPNNCWDPLSDATMTAWFYFSGNYSASYPRIHMTYTDSGNTTNVDIQQTTGLFIWEVTDSGTYRAAYSDFATANNTWVHMAGLYGTGGMRLYLDDVLQDNYSGSGDSSTFSWADIAPSIYTRISDSTYGWQGLIGEVRVYNDRLTAEEIKYLYLMEEYFYDGTDNEFILYGDVEDSDQVGTIGTVFPGILSVIGISALFVFIIIMVAGLSQIFPLVRKLYGIARGKKW